MSKCVKCGNEILTGDIHWEMGLCNNCYNELYKDHKTHISLDNMWLKLAQDFRDENEKLQDKVTDLEAKLVLKSSFSKFTLSDELYKLYINLEREYTKSSQEIAERGKEIEKLRVMLDTSLTKLHKARRKINRVLLKIAKFEAELDNYTIQNETFLKRGNQHE